MQSVPLFRRPHFDGQHPGTRAPASRSFSRTSPDPPSKFEPVEKVLRDSKDDTSHAFPLLSHPLRRRPSDSYLPSSRFSPISEE